MTRRFLKGFLTLLFLCSALILRAQLDVISSQTSGNVPNYYVNNVLLGVGVTASNITFSGTDVQIGEFTNNNTVLSMDSGCILSSGDVELAEGPNNAGSTGLQTLAPGDSDLFILSGDPIFDAAVLEFDFVPSGDTVAFNYTFASDEYNEFVGGSVNDAFGFFLSGPGISGGQGFANDAVNLAVVPINGTQVSINTVNLDSNSAYYLNNDTGNTMEYDGLTVKMRAAYEVVCGDTYHIKLAIGDGGDGIYDSGVFLEAGSFSSNFIDINLQSDNGDTTISEGCGEISLTFDRDDICYDAEIGLVFSGTATNGVDFPLLPDSIFLPAGVADTSVTFQPFMDGLQEGPETFTITATRISFQGDTFTATETFTILDSSKIAWEASPDTALICRPDTLTLYAHVTGGGPPPYTYTWNNGATGDTVQYFPSFGPGVDTVIVVMRDSCELSTARDTILIQKLYPDPLNIQILNDSLVNCSGDSLRLEYVLTGGTEPRTFAWSTGDTTAFIDLVVTGPQQIIITASDSCGDTSADTAFLGVKTPKPFGVNFPDTTTFCIGSSITIDPEFSGGVEPIEFSWMSNPTTFDADSTYQFILNQDTTIQFAARDACGRLFNRSFYFDGFEVDSLSLSLPVEEALCSGDDLEFIPDLTGGLTPYQYEWSTGDTDSVLTFVGSVSQLIGLTVTDFCGNQIEEESYLEVSEYQPLEILLSGDTKLCFGDEYIINVNPRGGAGGYSIEWISESGPELGEQFEKLDSNRFKVISRYSNTHFIRLTDRCGVALTDTVNIEVEPCVFIPNVISPNGDGLNDAFYIENILNFDDAHLFVYNRWGQRVFEAKSYRNEWVPVDQPSGTYYYVLRSSNFPELRGNLTIMNEE